MVKFTLLKFQLIIFIDLEAIKIIIRSELCWRVYFRHCALLGIKKLAGIKLLVDSAFEDKTLSNTRKNCVIKAFKDGKQPK